MTHRPIFYDTESTGIKVDRDRIIELAAYDPQRQRSFVQFINPGCPIPSDATAIHHITDDMVANAPSFAAVAQSFIEFCEGDVILIAHNNDSFDMPFMKHEFTRHGVAMPSWRFFDSLKWARRYRPDLPRHSLQHLREVYGIPANNAHRALDDVMVLHEVFKLMTDDLPIDLVCALIQKPKAMHSMPFGKYQGKPLADVPKDYLRWLQQNGAFDKAENHELKSSLETLGLLAT